MKSNHFRSNRRRAAIWRASLHVLTMTLTTQILLTENGLAAVLQTSPPPATPSSPRISTETVTRYAGLPNFQRVNDRLFRGGQPTREGLAKLKELGVRTIIDLREGNGSSGESEQARALGIRYYSIPMGNLRAPNRAAMDRVLGIIAESDQTPVYVHCRRGCDRTGTVVACYRIANESWTAEKAIAEALDHGMLGVEFLKRAFIRRFDRSRKTAHSDAVATARAAPSGIASTSTQLAGSAVSAGSYP